MLILRNNNLFIMGSAVLPMVTCEICERKEAEIDGLIDGDYKQVCRQCATLNGVIVVEKPSEQKIQESMYRRPKVRQVLSRMAGINKENYSPDRPVQKNPYSQLRIPASRKNVSLDDLREVKRANEAEEKQLNAEVNQIEDVEAEVEEHKSKISWFKRLFGMKKKEEFKEIKPGETLPGPAADSGIPPARKVRVIDSREN